MSLYLHGHAFRDFQFDEVVPDLGNTPEQATIGDDLVALCQGLNHLFVLLGLFALRTDQQEVENDKDKDQRQQAGERITLTLWCRGHCIA